MCGIEKLMVMWINRIFIDMGAGEWVIHTHGMILKGMR